MITFTDMQMEISNKTGCFVVNACPGSGKTLAVAARMATLLREWPHWNRGIAAMSFTNVAWQEIEHYLNLDFNVKIPITYPHFLGTIDSFIDRYIFLPFGHLVMGCNSRPKLIGPPHDDWEPIHSGWRWGHRDCYKTCELNQFSYNINGHLVNFSPRSHSVNCTLSQKFCLDLKTKFNRIGFATQLDANYFAMTILQKYDQIAKALIHKFPHIMIDEAQDSSEIQLKIIDILLANGHNEIMLIGDPNQAIFEWRTANPQLFISKYNQWAGNSCCMNENWRSSQNICNFFSRISSREQIPIARNDDYKNYSFVPDIWAYNDGDYQLIIDRFVYLCRENNIELKPSRIVILSRSKELISEMQSMNNIPRLDPWNDDKTKNLIIGKQLFENHHFKEACTAIEKAVYGILQHNDKKLANLDFKQFVNDYGFTEWRKSLFSIISLLPTTKNAKLNNWIIGANKVLQKNNINYLLSIKKDRKPNVYSELFLDNLFHSNKSKTEGVNYTLGTVHSVKGESYDAVLLFVKSRGANNQNYETILNGNSSEMEELRIIYVAITRPRKILIIAVPNNDLEIWRTKFISNKKN